MNYNVRTVQLGCFWAFIALLFGFGLLLGCEPELDRSNPYDEKSRFYDPPKASIAGQLILEEQSTGRMDPVTVTLEGEGQSLTTTSDEGGAFAFRSSVEAGNWTIRFSIAKYQEVSWGPVSIGSGDVITIPTVQMLLRRAVLLGRVMLDGIDENGLEITDFSGVTLLLRQELGAVSSRLMSLTREGDGDAEEEVEDPAAEDGDSEVPGDTDPEEALVDGDADAVEGGEGAPDEFGRTYSAITDPDGNYYFPSIPYGKYELIAGKEGFSSAGDLIDLGSENEEERRMSAITLISSIGAMRIDDAAVFTKSLDVTVHLKASGLIKRWWLSEDPEFLDPAVTIEGEVPLNEQTDYIEESFTLSPGDGERFIYGSYTTLSDMASDVSSDAIILDTTPPENGGVLMDVGSKYMQDSGGMVSLKLSAEDLHSGVLGMRVTSKSDDEGAPIFDGVPVQDYKIAHVEPVDVSEAFEGDEFSVWVTFLDGAGNESAPSTDAVLYDFTPPILSDPAVIINGGESKASDPLVRLDFDVSGAYEMTISNNPDFAGAFWQPFMEAVAGWPLKDGDLDGEKTVYARFRDEAGNEPALPSSSSTTLDTQSPVGVSVTISDTNGYTKSLEVQIAIQGADTYSADGELTYYISNLPSFSGAERGDCIGDGDGESGLCSTGNGFERTWTLSDGEGVKTVYVRLKDQAGNIAEATTTTHYDNTAPTGTINILNDYYRDADEDHSISTAVKLTATDDTIKVALPVTETADIPECTALPAPQWKDFSRNKTVQLVYNDTENGKTNYVWLCLKDRAGNISTHASLEDAAYDTCVVDANAPEGTVGFAETGPVNDRYVTLELVDDSGDVSEIAIANESIDCGTASYQPFFDTISWILDDDNGSMTVYVCFRDRAGNTGTASGDIYLDQIPPDTTVQIGAGASTITTTTVDLTFSTTLDSGDPEYSIVWKYAISNSASMDCTRVTSWTAYPLTNPAKKTGHTLASPPGGEGSVFVTACFKDEAGNLSSHTAGVYVDIAKPTGTISLQNDYYSAANYTSAIADLTASPDIDNIGIVVNTDGAVPDCETDVGVWESFNSSITVTNLMKSDMDEDGIVNYVYLCLKDVAGNISDFGIFQADSIYDSCVVDTNAPEGTVGFAETSPVNNRNVTLELEDDSGDIENISIANESINCGTVAYQPFVDTTSWTLDDVHGSRSVYVCYKDYAGNTSSSNAGIDLDLVSPDPGRLVLAGGAPLVSDPVVPLVVNGGIDELLVTLGGDLEVGSGTYWCNTDEDGEGGYGTLPTTVTLPSGDSLKTATAFFTDPAGNESAVFLDVIELDTTPPALGTITVNRNTWVEGDDPVSIESPSVTVAISTAEADVAYFEVHEVGANLTVCEPWTDGCSPATSTIPYTFTSANSGVITLYYRFFDRAFNGTDDGSGGALLGQFMVDLVEAPQVTRPVPELELIEPDSIIAMSAGSYAVTAVGRGFAQFDDNANYNTRLRIGNFELAADCKPTMNLPPGVICTDANEAGTSCDGDPDCRNCCQVLLDPASPAWDLVKIAGTYVVRAVTPEPVEGTGVSSETDFLHVVAPMPEIYDFTVLDEIPSNISVGCLNGVIDDCGQYIPYQHKRYVMESTEAQDFVVLLWGRKMMDNVFVRLENTYAQVQAVVDDDDPPEWDSDRQIVVAEFTGLDLLPQEVTYEFAVGNPTPGGGEDSTGFGVNWQSRRRTQNSPDTSSIRKTDIITRKSNLWEERHANPSDSMTSASILESHSGIYMDSTKGGTVIEGRDGSDRLLYRLPGGQPGSGVPLGTDLWGLRRSGPVGAFTWYPVAGRDAVPNGSFGGSSTTSDVGTDPTSSVVSDFDGDGRLDIAVVNESSNDVSVLLGTGGNFKPQIRSDVGLNPFDLAAGDFNGDDLTDLAVANNGSGDFSILLGKGDGTFQDQRRIHVGGNFVKRIAVGDFNSDGIDDIVLSHEKITIYLGKGDGSFHLYKQYSVNFNPEFLVVGDVNSDNEDDILINEQNDLKVFLGDGTGSFHLLATRELGLDPCSLTLGDFDGDGAMDLASANESYPAGQDDDVTVLLGKGDGTFPGPPTYLSAFEGAESTSPGDIASGDVNGDGMLDLVVSIQYDYDGTDYLDVFLGNGNGTFQTKMGYQFPSYGLPKSVKLADFNRDKALDIALPMFSKVMVLFGGNDNYHHPVANWGRGNGELPEAVAAGDFNCDGLPDLALACRDNDCGLQIFLNLGDENYDNGNPCLLSTGGAVEDIAVGDFNGDGFADLAMGRYKLYILWGDGSGSFTLEQEKSVYALGLTVGDLNGDGKQDIIAANYYNPGEVNVLTGIGDGYFNDPVPTTVGKNPVSVEAADLNNDGILDVAVTNSYDHNIGILWGDGAGGFDATHTDLTTGSFPLGIVSGDFNGDGFLDLVVTNSSPNYPNIGVFMNNGDKTFQDQTTHDVGEHPSRVDAGDLDGDGNLDLAVTNQSSDTVSMLLGDGEGGFASTVNYAAGVLPKGVLIADINNDGASDVVMTNLNTDKEEILIYFPAVNPKGVYQELSELVPDSKPVNAGSNIYAVNQGLQELESAAVRVVIDFPAIPAQGALNFSLVTPDKRNIGLLGTYTSADVNAFPTAGSPLSYRLYVHYMLDIPAAIDAFQPAGEWTVTINNGFKDGKGNDIAGELLSFAVVTRGRLYGPRLGDRVGRPEVIAVPPYDTGVEGRVIHGTTLGFTDKFDLTCASTGATGGAPDHVYEFTLAESAVLSFKVTASFDAVMELREGKCDDCAVITGGCDDNSFVTGKKNPAIIDLSLDEGKYCIIVDGVFDDMDNGNPADDVIHSGVYDLFITY